MLIGGMAILFAVIFGSVRQGIRGYMDSGEWISNVEDDAKAVLEKLEKTDGDWEVLAGELKNDHCALVVYEGDRNIYPADPADPPQDRNMIDRLRSDKRGIHTAFGNTYVDADVAVDGHTYYVAALFDHQDMMRESEHMEQRFSGLLWKLFLLILLLILMGWAFSRYLVNRMMEPLDLLMDGLKRTAAGDLEHPVDYHGDAELESVCLAFNQMQETIRTQKAERQQYEQSRTDMITSISHDLRTPLTSVKGYIKAVLDGVPKTQEMIGEYLKIAYDATGDMDRLLQKLFLFSKVIGLPDAVHLGGEVRGEGAEAAAGGDVIDLGLGDIHHVGHVVAVLVPGLQMLHDLQELGGLIVVGNGGGLAVVRQHTQVIGVVAHLVHTGIDENAGAVVRSDQRRVGVLFVYLGEELIQLVQGDGVTVLVAELRGDVGPHGVHGGGGHIQQTGDAIAGSVQVPALKYVFTDGLADLIRVRLDQLSNVHGLAAGNSGGEILDPEHINGIVAGREQQVQLLGLVGVLHHDEFHIGADLFTGDGADGLFDHGHILGHGQAGHHHLNGGVALLRAGGGSLTGPGSGGRLGVAFTGAAGSQGKQHGQRKNAGQHSLDTLLHLFCFLLQAVPGPSYIETASCEND